MLTDEDLSMGNLVNLMDGSDPRKWSDTVDQVDLSRNPFRRLEMAAIELGLFPQHVAQENNGVDHGP